MEDLALVVSLLFLAVLFPGLLTLGLSYWRRVPTWLVFSLASVALLAALWWQLTTGVWWVTVIAVVCSLLAFWRRL